MEFGTRFGMAPGFSGVVSHSREALARTMEYGKREFKAADELRQIHTSVVSLELKDVSYQSDGCQAMYFPD
ncbi:hypothetical protein Tco_0013251 [Tanacetum coccineum]